jgi:Rrf2 family iron-sulfur cluster assembly transcriptional regulator
MPSIIGPSVRQRTDREDRALWPSACSCLFVPMLAGTPTSKLRLQGLVTSIRGPGGGYTLGGRMDGITVADILSAVEGEPSITKQPDASSAQDMAQDLWDAMNAKVLHFTQSVTLKSLVFDQLAMGVKIEQKPLPNRGVFKKPDQPTTHPNVPNSVFAPGRTTRTHG